MLGYLLIHFNDFPSFLSADFAIAGENNEFRRGCVARHDVRLARAEAIGTLLRLKPSP